MEVANVKNKRLRKVYENIKEDEEYCHELNKGVSEDNIRKTEEKIGVKLPQDYREFLKNTNGGKLYNSTIDLTEVYEIDRDEGKHSGVGYIEDEIFEIGNPYGVPEGFLVISDTGYGDLVCIDTKSRKKHVVYWNHETLEVEEIWESFLEWLEDAVQDSKELLAE